jgi:hypothetical protein
MGIKSAEIDADFEFLVNIEKYFTPKKGRKLFRTVEKSNSNFSTTLSLITFLACIFCYFLWIRNQHKFIRFLVPIKKQVVKIVVPY